jgi:hypothetical protein
LSTDTGDDGVVVPPAPRVPPADIILRNAKVITIRFLLILMFN